jgi:hypothetical protein
MRDIAHGWAMLQVDRVLQEQRGRGILNAGENTRGGKQTARLPSTRTKNWVGAHMHDSLGCGPSRYLDTLQLALVLYRRVVSP